VVDVVFIQADSPKLGIYVCESVLPPQGLFQPFHTVLLKNPARQPAADVPLDCCDRSCLFATKTTFDTKTIVNTRDRSRR
jgi:hypothetical protein